MAGIGIWVALDVLKKSPAFTAQSFHSYSYFSATTAAAAASALAFFPNYPSFASQHFFSGAGLTAYCDAGVAAAGRDEYEYIPNVYNGYGEPSTANYVRVKTYSVEPKPLFSAFGWKTLGMTTIRSLLIFYLPLLELDDEQNDYDSFEDARQEQPPVDLVVPFKKSVKQICRETAVLTTRRVLERLAVHTVSQRMAWKLLKDLPKSAQRKACRHMNCFQFFFCVSRSTFRGHFLGIAASWLVQVGIESYHCISDIWKHENETERDNRVQRFKKKVLGTTARCGVSLVCASIGAGLGATLIRPSTGQWIGCAIGDTAGPIIGGFVLQNLD